jgi:hypothetical protein
VPTTSCGILVARGIAVTFRDSRSWEGDLGQKAPPPDLQQLYLYRYSTAMTSPVQENEQSSFPAIPEEQHDNSLEEKPHRRSSDEDGTLQGDVPHDGDDDALKHRSPLSPLQQREVSRLDDDLRVLQAEREVSKAKSQQDASDESTARSRSRTAHEPVDEFDISPNPIHGIKKIYKPPTIPATKLAKFFIRIHASSFLVRYFFYITPLTLLLTIPTVIGLLVYKKCTVGDVELFWFGIWLEIVWLTLWLSRVSLPSQYQPFILTDVPRSSPR